MLGDVSPDANSRAASLDLDRHGAAPATAPAAGSAAAAAAVGADVLLRVTESKASGSQASGGGSTAAGAAGPLSIGGGGGPKIGGATVPTTTTLLDPTALRLALQNAAMAATASAKKQMELLSHNTGVTLAGAFGAGFRGFFGGDGGGRALSTVDSTMLDRTSDLASELGAVSSDSQRRHLVVAALPSPSMVDEASELLLQSSPRHASSINCMTQLQVRRIDRGTSFSKLR